MQVQPQLMAFLSPQSILVRRSNNDVRCRQTHANVRNITQPIRMASSVPRRTILQSVALSLMMPNAFASAETEAEPTKTTTNAKVTNQVYMDVKIAGTEVGRITIGLFGEEAPESVASFLTATGPGIRGRAGLVVGYKYSVGSRVSAGKYVELGRVKQIDALNQSAGTAQRQTRIVLPPENRETNSLSHDQRGVVSLKRGGGAFEFSIALATVHELDADNIVVGRVLQGDEVLERLGNVPTNKKTVRDGFRSVGKVIGDARAKVDVRVGVVV